MSIGHDSVLHGLLSSILLPFRSRWRTFSPPPQVELQLVHVDQADSRSDSYKPTLVSNQPEGQNRGSMHLDPCKTFPLSQKHPSTIFLESHGCLEPHSATASHWLRHPDQTLATKCRTSLLWNQSVLYWLYHMVVPDLRSICWSQALLPNCKLHQLGQ